MGLRKILLKQYNTGTLIGAYISLYNRTGVFVSFISMFMLGSTFWATGAKDFIHQWFPQFPFWLFLLLLALVLHLAMLLAYVIAESSIYAYANRQGWKHDNPSREEFSKLNKKIDERFDQLGMEIIDLKKRVEK